MHRLTQRIVELERRLVWCERAAAACRVVAVVLGAALVLGLVDYLVRFRDPGLRIMATAALVSAAMWAVYRWWYLPGRRPWSLLRVARRVESRFPQLGDSLSSALEFLRQSEDDPTAGSAQLRRVVVSETLIAVDDLPIDEVIDRRPLRRAAGWLVAALAALGLCVAMDGRAVSIAAARLAVPLGTAEWPRQHYLVFRDAPTRLAAGQTFEVELVDKAGSLPEDVRIEYRMVEDGRPEFSSEPMIRAGGVMRARRENVRRSFAFRAVGGDDLAMRWRWVEVVEPPQLESLEIAVHPPAYTALPARAGGRHMRLLAGTGIALRGAVDKPIRSARVLRDWGEPIAAAVRADAAGNPSRAFVVEPGQWIAERSGPYRLELTDRQGVSAVVGEWKLRVAEDPPPSVSWSQPEGDVYVTPTAVVPIELLVRDNLAIQRVDLIYERNDRSEAELARQPIDRIELYRGPKQPAAEPTERGAQRDEYRKLEHRWELAPLELPVGATITLHGEAADYRPGIGRTVVPRQLRVASADEVEARLAERQQQIVRQLERALAVQRATRSEVRPLTLRPQAAELAAEDRRAIRSAELNQRRVGRTLVDPRDGVPPLVDAVLRQIEMNGMAASSGIYSALRELSAELDRLRAGPLDVAERELTAARKDAETRDGRDSEAASRSLLASLAAQDEIVATLERLVTVLAGKADYGRIVRQLAELRDDQSALHKEARSDIGLETLPLRLGELNRAQRSALVEAAADQTALAARLEKIEQAMDQLSREAENDESDAVAALADAIELSRRLAIQTKLRAAAADFAANRVGQAFARQTEAASDLQQILDILRRRNERRPEQIADGLRDAAQRLAKLREQLAALERRIGPAERRPGADAEPRAKLGAEQQSLREEIEQLARRLERLQAADAARSAQRAADHLENRRPADKASAGEQVRQANEELAKAAEKIAQRRQQAEDDLALEFVRRFQAELGKMVERQRHVVERTDAIGAQQAAPVSELAEELARLAEEERQLSGKALQYSELLFGLGAVRVGLEDAKRLLDTAAALLDKQQTGAAVQAVARRALERLEAMAQAFVQTAEEAAPKPPSPANPGAAAGGQQLQRRPTFELLEVKMLRLLQTDLNERTAAYRQRIHERSPPIDAARQAELHREAQELAAEQGRLAELVEEMLSRDNEE